MTMTRVRDAPEVIVLDDWQQAKLATLPGSCLIRCLPTVSNTSHCEQIEISISSFTLRNHSFIECSSESWPCCSRSSVDGDGLLDDIRGFYARHLTPGQWVDHGYVRPYQC